MLSLCAANLIDKAAVASLRDRPLDVARSLRPRRRNLPRVSSLPSGSLNELSRRPRCDTKQRKSIFSDFEFSKITFSKFLRQLLIETTDEASGWSDRHLVAMVDRCSTLLCMMKLGGFQTFSLRDQLFIPANYFEVADLLYAEGAPDSDLIGTDARRWVNRYTPSREQLDRELTDAAFFELVGVENHDRRQGVL